MMPTDHRSGLLERRYRKLLIAYPPEYRTERGDELIGTLMSASEPGQRWPSLGEAADLLWNGLRTRGRLTRRTLGTPAAAGARAYAGMLALAVATMVAADMAISISVQGNTIFPPGDTSIAYPLPVRAGLAAFLAVFPLAVLTVRIGSGRLSTWLAGVGAVGAVGFATWLVMYAFETDNEDVKSQLLFGLVAVYVLPAALLHHPSMSKSVARPSAGRWIVYTGLLVNVVILGQAVEHLMTIRAVQSGAILPLTPDAYTFGLSVPLLVVVAAATGVAQVTLAGASSPAPGRRLGHGDPPARRRDRVVGHASVQPARVMERSCSDAADTWRHPQRHGLHRSQRARQAKDGQSLRNEPDDPTSP